MTDKVINDIDLGGWDFLIEKTQKLKHDICTSSGIVNFEIIRNKLQDILQVRNLLVSDLLDKNYSAVYLNLILNTKYTNREVVSKSLIEKIVDTYGGIITFTLLQNFISLYFALYDNLQDNAIILIRYILHGLKNTKNQYLKKYRKNENDIFNKDFNFHQKVVEDALKSNDDLAKILQKYGLFIGHDGRFYEKLRLEYFVKRMERLTLDEVFVVLDEIDKLNIFEKDFDNNYCLGHKIIHILLEKLSAKIRSIKKYQNVINYILQYAGDPRNNQSTVLYQHWWLVLGQTDIARMKACLSGFDLELFLEIYSEFVQKGTSHSDPQRMFIDRKKFLQGMMMNNLIHETKLFVGTKMEDYIKRHYKNLPTIFSITDNPEMAVIYMKYNDMLFTEGTFNCKFRAYKEINKFSPFFKKNKYYTYRDLGQGYWDNCTSLGIESFDQVHHNGNWQEDILSKLSKWVNKNSYRKGYFYTGYGR